MRKKVVWALSIILGVAALATGATIAYFYDVEKSSGNTISAGTIDLAVNGDNPLDEAVVTIEDVKPSQNVKDVEVTLSNVGRNDGIADLHIGVGTADEGIDSEPECVAENKTWNGTRCTGQETENENICEMINYDYCYDANGNGKCDDEDPQGTLDASQEVYLDVLPAGVSRKLWLSHHLKAEAGNEYQGDVCTYDIDFTLKQLGYKGAPADSPVVDFVDIGNGASERSKTMKGWSNTVWPQGGGWGGGDDGTIRTVSAGSDDTYKETYPDLDSAIVEMDFGDGGNYLYIRHLDGYADDSFDVYVDGTKVGSYSDSYSTETWLTSKFDTRSFSGVHTVRIKLTGSHWDGYNNWGQLGISWIKVGKSK